jgi:hypothetical protein
VLAKCFLPICQALSHCKKVHMLQSSLVWLLAFEEQYRVVKFGLGFTTERASKLYIAAFAEE